MNIEQHSEHNLSVEVIHTYLAYTRCCSFKIRFQKLENMVRLAHNILHGIVVKGYSASN